MNQLIRGAASSFFYLTAEIRWFRPGKVPEEIGDWFNRSAFEHRPGVRTDTYLVYPTAEAAGVKFRENRFEIKTFVKTLDGLSIRERIRGRMEVWEKWSMEGVSVAGLFADTGGEPDIWIDVRKRRTTRVFSTEGEKIVETDSSERSGLPGNGCFIELTDIGIGEEQFWTLGLEAFGIEESLEDNLRRTAIHFFDTDEVSLGFEEKDSYSYPVFLRKFHYGSFTTEN
jgi:hypothetical protein